MASVGNFRAALNGFNRQDVANYIEYMNNKHTSELSQLQAQLDRSREENEALRKKLEEVSSQPAQVVVQETVPSDAELEAYRRAERTERMANERAQKIREQANVVLSVAAEKAEASAKQMDAAAQAVLEQLQQCRSTIQAGSDSLHSAIGALAKLGEEE